MKEVIFVDEDGKVVELNEKQKEILILWNKTTDECRKRATYVLDHIEEFQGMELEEALCKLDEIFGFVYPPTRERKVSEKA